MPPGGWQIQPCIPLEESSCNRAMQATGAAAAVTPLQNRHAAVDSVAVQEVPEMTSSRRRTTAEAMRSPAVESIAAAMPDTSIAESAPRPTYSTMLEARSRMVMTSG